MVVTDKIGDLIIRIKNANRVGKASAAVPASLLKEAVAHALMRAGFLTSVSKTNDGKTLELGLAYTADKMPKVTDVARVSKPSRRIYKAAADIKPFKNGFGATIFSTPKGILIDKEAVKQKVGGEEMFRIW